MSSRFRNLKDQDDVTEKRHYKMFKAGKRWMYSAILLFFTTISAYVIDDGNTAQADAVTTTKNNSPDTTAKADSAGQSLQANTYTLQQSATAATTNSMAADTSVASPSSVSSSAASDDASIAVKVADDVTDKATNELASDDAQKTAVKTAESAGITVASSTESKNANVSANSGTPTAVQPVKSDSTGAFSASAGSTSASDKQTSASAGANSSNGLTSAGSTSGAASAGRDSVVLRTPPVKAGSLTPEQQEMSNSITSATNNLTLLTNAITNINADYSLGMAATYAGSNGFASSSASLMNIFIAMTAIYNAFYGTATPQALTSYSNAVLSMTKSLTGVLNSLNAATNSTSVQNLMK